MLLEARNLKKSYKEKHVKAVDDVSFSVARGRTLGVVGESGSGKSTLAKLALGLIAPDAGEVYFEGQRLSRMKWKDLKNFRKRVQVVFQEPTLSLDPRMKVADILKEPFLIAGERGAENLERKIAGLLSMVELSPGFASRYPRELSGGESQRVAIARALATEPELIVCDEPVSSLDAVAQIQILNLLLRLQADRKVAYLFISHDLKVVRHMSDDVLVLKEGRVCESGPRDEVYLKPKNSYTKALVQASAYLLGLK